MGYNYIMFQHNDKAGNPFRQFPVFYPDFIPHVDMANAVIGAMPELDISVMSAGQAEIDVHACHGMSTTLGVSSDPDDATVANGFPYFHGLL